ncbi:hypothetical protein GPJ56_003583 [Histomonas meleagridis]|uniref:uncharacterized protein n=1 Tax=Histomonas meleagridis TaxID=135588 RepID=UPI0035593F5F|nr:hypothetical protein GPJ56_003583 [Histomonas meleagridis]KAH0800653.1 hypothetical protein GO595_006406 [Histomonas meleagridis]
MVSICDHSIECCRNFIELGIFQEGVMPMDSFKVNVAMLQITRAAMEYKILPMNSKPIVELAVSTCIESDDDQLLLFTLNVLAVLFQNYYTFDVSEAIERLASESENENVFMGANVLYKMIHT